MIRITIFFFRFNIFILAYLTYCTNVLFLLLNFKIISKKLFHLSAYLCSISLGIKYKIDKNSKLNLLKKGIHTVNHDNPLDIFVAQCIFRIPTITTVDDHLKNLIPFFKESISNFGHFNFDYLDFNKRKLAYLFLQKQSRIDKNILIFPSGSIYTPITKRFSKSISILSKKNNLDVITWKIYFEGKQGSFVKYEKNVYNFIFKRFLAESINLVVKEFKIFSPLHFKSEDELHEKLRSFYIN